MRAASTKITSVPTSYTDITSEYPTSESVIFFVPAEEFSNSKDMYHPNQKHLRHLLDESNLNSALNQMSREIKTSLNRVIADANNDQITGSETTPTFKTKMYTFSDAFTTEETTTFKPHSGETDTTHKHTQTTHASMETTENNLTTTVVHTTKPITMTTHERSETTQRSSTLISEQTTNQKTTTVTAQSTSTILPTRDHTTTEGATTELAPTLGPQVENTTHEAVGCPYYYSWCFNTPAILLWQFLLGTFFVAVGYPVCNVMSYAIYSKMLGPKPQVCHFKSDSSQTDAE